MNPERWLRVEELFHSALERPPQQRQAFLDGECGGDVELRQEVELLLARGEQAGSFLEVSPLDGMAGAPAAAGSLVGRQLGSVSVNCFTNFSQSPRSSQAWNIGPSPFAVQPEK